MGEFWAEGKQRVSILLLKRDAACLLRRDPAFKRQCCRLLLLD